MKLGRGNYFEMKVPRGVYNYIGEHCLASVNFAPGDTQIDIARKGYLLAMHDCAQLDSIKEMNSKGE